MSSPTASPATTSSGPASSCASRTTPFRDRVNGRDLEPRSFYTHASRGPVAQLAEQGTFNPKVVGSIPTRPIEGTPSKSRPFPGRCGGTRKRRSKPWAPLGYQPGPGHVRSGRLDVDARSRHASGMVGVPVRLRDARTMDAGGFGRYSVGLLTFPLIRQSPNQATCDRTRHGKEPSPGATRAASGRGPGASQGRQD